MFFFAYKSLKHQGHQCDSRKKLYFGRNLNLPLDLLRGYLPSNKYFKNVDRYTRNSQRKIRRNSL